MIRFLWIRPLQTDDFLYPATDAVHGLRPTQASPDASNPLLHLRQISSFIVYLQSLRFDYKQKLTAEIRKGHLPDSLQEVPRLAFFKPYAFRLKFIMRETLKNCFQTEDVALAQHIDTDCTLKFTIHIVALLKSSRSVVGLP